MDRHNRQMRNKLSSYLKGKRVAIVGPAPSVVGSKQAELINSYDVVVRLNKALPVPKELREDVGTRCDILYNCMNPSEECGGIINISTLKKCKVKYLIGAYPPVDKVGNTKLRIKTDTITFYTKNRSNWKNFCYTDKGHFLKLWKHMRLPNTGTMAILDLLRFDIKELYITGITFFKGGYIRTYRDYDEHGILTHLKKFNLHKPSKQLDFACKQLTADSRVKMDETLTKIVRKRYAILNGDKPENDYHDNAEDRDDYEDDNRDDDEDENEIENDNRDDDEDNNDNEEDDLENEDNVQEEDRDFSDDTLEKMASSSISIFTRG